MLTSRNWTRTICTLFVVGVCLAAATTARALINPRFTPVDMTEQSKLILVLELTVDAKGKVSTKVVSCVAGKNPKSICIDLGATRKEQAEAFIDNVKSGPGQLVMLFHGKYKEQGAGGGAAASRSRTRAPRRVRASASGASACEPGAILARGAA